jgi:hypothetical protein
MEGALVREVEARLVSVEKAELGSGGQVGKGGGHAGEPVFLGAAFHAVFQEAGFDGPGAAEAPIGGGHLLDHADFDVIDGAKAAEVQVEQRLEILLGFALHDYAPGEEAMAHGVAGRVGLTLRGLGAARAGAVGTGGQNAFLRNHIHRISD